MNDVKMPTTESNIRGHLHASASRMPDYCVTTSSSGLHRVYTETDDAHAG